MTPYDKARAVYDQEECARTFEEDLVAHLNGGYVINTPEVFGMFRPVRRIWGKRRILNPWDTIDFTVGSADTWHIYLAAGDMSQFMNFLPYALPWISFERKNKLRFRSFHQMAEKLSQHERIQRTPLRA